MAAQTPSAPTLSVATASPAATPPSETARTGTLASETASELGPAAGADRRLRTVTIILAVACGLSVANQYYAQPVLAPIARAFGVSEGAAALVVTVSQIGYAAGLVLLVPLGDLVENRRLACTVLLGTAVALLAAAGAPTLAAFMAAAVAVGVTSVVAQILVPLAAHLAPEAHRGQVVGRVMSGLLLGVLLARTVSSLIAGALGWRSVYLLSAAAMLALSLTLWRMLPTRRPSVTMRYPALLRSLGGLLRDERILRRRAAYQAVMFGAFSVFWTAIGYELAGPNHRLSQTEIGLFALVGASGAISAPIAGRLGDKGRGHLATGIALGVGAVAMALSGFGYHSLVVLGVAGVLLDAAVQMTLVTGQQAIYAVRPEARARMNTAYIATFFLGGAVGSALAGVVYGRFEWPGVAALGAALPAVGLLLWAYHTVRDRILSAGLGLASDQ
jgi:predicted MFS family arabinose efflux permease